MNSVVPQPSPGAVVIQRQQSVVVTRPGGKTVIVDKPTPPQVVVTRGIPGPRGPRGIPGPAGGATTVPVGATAISGHSAVACGPDGLLIPADCSISAHLGAVLGLVADAYSSGEDAVVQTNFVLEHAGWTWATGPVFVGLAGQLTQTLPPAALFAQVVGQALSATRVLVDLQPPIHIA